MRVALISDSHGNAVGLRAALEDIERRGADLVVALGDMAQGGPQPTECLELLRDMDARVVLGNSDAFLLDADAGAEITTERQLTQRDWSLSQLTPTDVDYMRSFEATVEVDLDGLRLLCFHAVPADYDSVVLPEDPPDAFTGTGADVLAGGHVHVQQLRRVGGAWYVNPGKCRDRLRPSPARRRLHVRSLGLVRDRRSGFGRVPPRCVRDRKSVV